MKKMATLCTIASISVLLAACSNEKKEVTDTNIIGSYVLVSSNDEPIQRVIPPELKITEDSDITKIKIEGQMCNFFNGQTIYQNGVLQAADGIAVTRMYCSEEELNNLDNIFGQMLANGAQVEKVNGKLIISSGHNTLVYKQKAQPLTQKDNTK